MSQLQQRLQQMHQIQMQQEMEQIFQHQLMLQQQQAAAAGSMPPPMLPHHAAAAAAHQAAADASTLDYFATGLAASAGLGIPGVGPIPTQQQQQQQQHMGGPDMGGGPPHSNHAGGFGARAGAASNGNGNYPLRDIDHPGVHDVMCGRGGGANNHIGNVQFRQLVNGYKLKYLAATKAGKPEVAREVVRIWRSLKPPGRFLAKVNPEDDNSLWYDVGDHKAREKASQCLRERTRGTPDLQKYLKELEAQKKPDQAKSEPGEGGGPNPAASADPSTVLSSPTAGAAAAAAVPPSTSPPPTSAKMSKAQKKEAVEDRIAAAAGRTIAMGVERAKKDAMSRASDAASQASSSRASKSKKDDDDFTMDDPSVVTSNIGSIATASTESAGLDQDEAAQRRREIRRMQKQQQTQLNLQHRLKKMQDAAAQIPMTVPSTPINLVSIQETPEDSNATANKKKKETPQTTSDKAAEDERRRKIMENGTPSALTAKASSSEAPQPDRVPSEGSVVPTGAAPPSLAMDIDNSSLWARIVDVLQNPLMDLPDDAPFEEAGPDLSSSPPRQSTSPTPVSHANTPNKSSSSPPKVNSNNPAPSLIKGAMVDNSNDDGFGDDFTLEDYQNSLRAFLTTAPSGSSICGTSIAGDDDYGPATAQEFDRSGFMDSMKSTDWMKTFHTLDSNSSTNNASVTLTEAAMSTRSGISQNNGVSASNLLRMSNATMPSGNLSGEGQQHYVANNNANGAADAPISPVPKPRPGLLRQKYSDKTFPSIESSVFMSTDNSLKLIDEDKQQVDGVQQPTGADIVYEPAQGGVAGRRGSGGGMGVPQHGTTNRSVGRQPRRASASRSEKMRSVLGTHSNLSMMSDLTGELSWSTSHRSRAGTAGTGVGMPPPATPTTPSQLSAAAAVLAANAALAPAPGLYKRSNTGGGATTSSNVSVMSEMSDISDRMLMMDLAQGSLGGSVDPH